VADGERVAAEQGCLKCHSVDGSRHIGPTWVDLYLRQEKLADGRIIVADEAYLTRSMMDPAADIVAGFQNVMPTYQGKLTPPEVAAIVEYIKSLKTSAVRSGPSAGPVYEPKPRQP
jgi:cytochrome c oxidase subunit 2